MSFPPLSPGQPTSHLPPPAGGGDWNNEDDDIDDDYDDEEYDGDDDNDDSHDDDIYVNASPPHKITWIGDFWSKSALIKLPN